MPVIGRLITAARQLLVSLSRWKDQWIRPRLGCEAA